MVCIIITTTTTQQVAAAAAGVEVAVASVVEEVRAGAASVWGVRVVLDLDQVVAEGGNIIIIIMWHG